VLSRNNIDRIFPHRYYEAMTDRGDFILVDSTNVGDELADILKAVELDHRRVRIVRNGRAVVELSPVDEPVLVPLTNPKLKVTFSPDYDPFEDLTKDSPPKSGWPQDRLTMDPKLMGVQFNEDPTAPLDDWHEDLR
jgi:hypothetical protein